MHAAAASSCAQCGNKVRLTGSVAGIDACEIVSDSDEILVGAGIDCDLVTADPIVPVCAFRLRRAKKHRGTQYTCDVSWTLEACPNARVYVNNRLTGREKIVFGDSISIGCHRFEFTRADAVPRNRRTNVGVADVCAQLLADSKIPSGFLNSWPDHLHLCRRRKALARVGALALILLLIVLIAPRREIFEIVQPPLEVVVVADQVNIPAPDATRSLSAVSRQKYEAAEAALKPPEMIRIETPALAQMEFKPLDGKETPLKPPAPETVKALADLETLKPQTLAAPPAAGLELKRDVGKLGESAPVRRLTVAEAAQAIRSGELAGYKVSLDEGTLRGAAFRLSNRAFTNAPPAPAREVLAADRAKRLEQLAVFKPSPVGLESYRGTQIPVARIAEELAKLDVASAPDEIKADGVVSSAEVAKCWKTGRFRMFAPGMPEASPPTYCYVSKTVWQNKPCLYVSFVCSDPDLNQIIGKCSHNQTSGHSGISAAPFIQDDSVEIYLDTNFDRRDYYQMIVTCKGYYWAAYLPIPDLGHPQTWNVAPVIKTSINKEAGQWVCEALIPFESLGGEPKKGARWAVNFCRNFRGQFDANGSSAGRVQCWFEIYEPKGSFHNPGRFGIFEW